MFFKKYPFKNNFEFKVKENVLIIQALSNWIKRGGEPKKLKMVDGVASPQLRSILV